MWLMLKNKTLIILVFFFQMMKSTLQECNFCLGYVLSSKNIQLLCMLCVVKNNEREETQFNFVINWDT